MTLLKRLTLVIKNGTIERVFYPVFPPDQNASEVLAWLAAKDRGREEMTDCSLPPSLATMLPDEELATWGVVDAKGQAYL